MQWLQLSVLVVISTLLIFLSASAVKAISLLEQILMVLRPTLHPGRRSMTNFCVWTFREEGWVLLEDRSEEGYVPGPPPARTGSYPGECIRMLSVIDPKMG